MKDKYEKPETKVVLLQTRLHLLQVSQEKGIKMDMSGYQKGDDDSDDDDDGWN